MISKKIDGVVVYNSREVYKVVCVDRGCVCVGKRIGWFYVFR